MKNITVGNLITFSIIVFGIILVTLFTLFDVHCECFPLWVINTITIIITGILSFITACEYEDIHNDEWYERKPFKNMFY